MKKLVIGALVGGLLVFLWQTLSWTVLNLHAKEYQKAPGQDTIMSFLANHFNETGQYYLPSVDADATAEEQQKIMDAMQGKPWAVVSYHKAYTANMVNNIIRGLLVSIISVLFVCWIIAANPNRTFGGIFISTVLIGIVGYLFIPYSAAIWFETPGPMTNFLDTLMSWGRCGVWLGWWFSRK